MDNAFVTIYHLTPDASSLVVKKKKKKWKAYLFVNTWTDCIYVFNYENVLSILLCAISFAVVRFALLSSVGSVMSTEWRIVRSQRTSYTVNLSVVLDQLAAPT